MLPDMRRLLDAFWRAAAYLLMPRVIGLSLLPLLIAGGLALALGFFFWEPAVAGVRASMESLSLVEALLAWLDRTAGPHLRAVIAPLIVVVLALPVVVVLSLLLVAWLMTPAIVSLVAERRFPQLERRRGAPWWKTVTWSLGYTLAALGALLLTLPIWFFIPPAFLILPPLIWGWLTAKVLGFEVLAEHADAQERATLLKAHAWPLLTMGVVTGFLGAAPSLLWAAGAVTLIMAPVLVPVAVWLYTLVFAFSALWFAHYALAALHQLRSDTVPVAEPQPTPASTPAQWELVSEPGATPPPTLPPA